jgi:hypothetical protein
MVILLELSISRVRMTTISWQPVRQNTVIVSPNTRTSLLFREAISRQATESNFILVIVSSVNNDLNRSPLEARLILSMLFSTLAKENPPSWIHVLRRCSYNRVSSKLQRIAERVRQQNDETQLMDVLTHEHILLRQLLVRLLLMTKKDYLIFMLTEFDALPIDTQPLVGKALQRITKGTASYFCLVSDKTPPILFRRNGKEEMGLQVDNDYVRVDL